MLFFETPFHWDLITECQRAGVKTVIMPMYECMPKVLPAEPDLWLCPSLLDLKYYCDTYRCSLIPPSSYGKIYKDRKGRRSTFIPVPVAVPWKQRYSAEVFIHNAGHGGLRGRNGTRELLDALHYSNRPIKLIIRSQKELILSSREFSREVLSRVEVRLGTAPYETLYEEGDVFVFPEKFNGLSLPLQEAYASGMYIIAVDRFPINTWLPGEGLVPAPETRKASVSARCHEFEEAVLEPRKIAEELDYVYGTDIREYSFRGSEWALENSWHELGPIYHRVLEGVRDAVRC
jgi:hypothetical protein